MNRSLLFVAILCILTFACNQSAFAEPLCKEGTVFKINPATQDEYCIIPSDNTLTEYNIIMARGIVASGGLGYAAPLAVNFNIQTGFDFGAINHAETLGFALLLDVDLNLGPFSLANFNATLAPTFYTSYHSFRFSLGLGVGFSSWLTHFRWSTQSTDTSHQQVVNFQLAPSLDFDWFITEHVWIGFGIKVQIIFYKIVDENSNYTAKYVSTLLLPEVDLIHVGYKFNLP